MKVLGRSHTLNLTALSVALALIVAVASPRGAAQAPPTETLTFVATADTWVQSSTPNTNYDEDPRVRADAGPERIGYLRFQVEGIDGRPVTDARLRLEVSGSSDDTGGTIHLISDETWDEATVTYATRPVVDGPGLDTLGPVSEGKVVDLDLTGSITTDGIYNLALTSTSDDGVTYVSNAAPGGMAPTLVITVAPGPEPIVTILQPPDSAIFFQGDAVPLQAAATDDVDDDLDAAIEWHSDRDGVLGTGPSISPILSEGDHAVTASVTDSDGFSGHDAIGLEVVPPPPVNTEPLVTITAPLDGQSFRTTEAISFRGSAADLEDGPLTDGLSWTSDQDGLIGQGGDLSTTLSAGSHDVTASVVDSDGLLGSATVRFSVADPPGLEFAAVADTYVDADTPATNYGAAIELTADAKPERIVYLRFEASGVGTRHVGRAVVRLEVGSGSSAGSDDGGTLHTVSDSTWDEDTLTHASRPAVDGPALGSIGAVDVGEIVEIDVTAAVTGDGTYSFALISGSSNKVVYVSREAGTPTLILTVDGHAPRVQITTPPDGTDILTTELPLIFGGTATDEEDGDLGNDLVWTSSLDGVLGTGSSITANLSPGTHDVTAAVTDADGARGEAHIGVVIRAPNTAPTVTIDTPANGATVVLPVGLRATATDGEDGDLSDQISWNSSVDGDLGTGATRSIASLSAGVHTITASVTDGDGATDSASVTITVEEATLAVVAEQDTYVDSRKQDTVLGSESRLRIDAFPVRQAYLRFRLNDIAPLAVQRAILRLTVGSQNSSASQSGGTVHALTDGNWTEATTTYANRPTIDGPALATHGAVGVDETVYFDVTAAIAGDGLYDFAIRTNSTDEVQYRSREASSGSPLLLLTLGPSRPPVLTITAPPSGTRILPGVPVALAATATDPDEGDISQRIVWRSNRSGTLGTGASLTVTLDPGVHTVTATITDSGGFSDTASIMIEVLQPPTVSISAPADGTVVSTADLPLRLAGSATDAEDGSLSSHIEWRSDRDGRLGTGAAIDTQLTLGEHAITASVTDSDDLSAQSQISVEVRAPNQSPQITITAPVNGTTVTAQVATELAAVVIDDFDVDLEDRISWTSSRDGNLGTGARTTAALSEGVHTLTARVTDLDGAVGTASVTVSALAATLSFAPDADTYVDADDRDTALGGEPILRADDSPVREAYLRFTVTGIAPLAVDRATLRLTVGAESRHESSKGGTVRRLADNSWSEATTTYETRPDVGSVLDTRGAVEAGDVVDFDVRDALFGDGTYDFAITTGSSDAVGYHSREAATGQPQLIITLVDNTPPEIAITAPAPGDLVLADEAATLEATATDANDGSLGDGILWRSDRDGSLGTGTTITTAALSQGTHLIAAEVTDSSGATSTATIDLIVDAPPTVTITSPAPGSLHFTTDAIQFSGTASDVIDGNLSSQLEWTSNLDGPLGTGTGLTMTTLSAGTHTVSARVTDSHDLTGNATVTVSVEVNDPPTVTIGAPANPTHLVAGTPVTFAATATDPEEGDLSAAIAWSSDRDGFLGAGSPLTSASLSVGTHLVRATATDSRGLAASATVTVTVEVNDPPLITINSPASGTTVQMYDLVVFAGNAIDQEDGDLTASLVWTSDRDGLLGTGAGFVAGPLGVGTHRVTALATDSLGVSGVASITLVVANEAPVVAITDPPNGLRTFVGNPLTFAGTAFDVEDGELTDQLRWRSSRDGLIGQGPRFVTTLSRGSHTITADATDSGGTTGSRSISVRVDPIPSGTSAPTVTVTEPADGAIFASGQPVRLTAIATDPDDGDIGHSVVWTSDIDHELATGESIVIATLSVGVHRIMAAATDSHGIIRFDEISLEIIPAVPMVTILLPTADAGFLRSKPVDFFAEAIDFVEGDVSDSLIWSSDRDGVIGTGQTLTTDSLSRGVHTVTAAATNSRGRIGTADVRFVISDTSVTFEAVADTYVDESEPDVNFGAASNLLVDHDPSIREAYLRFDVTDIGTLAIDQARLKLQVSGSGGSDFGGTVHLLRDGGWTEDTTTFNSRPVIVDPPLTTVGVSVEPNESVEFDVTSALTGDGSYDFAMVSPSADAVRYRSREADSGHPKLTVRLRQADGEHIPELTITAPEDGLVIFDDTAMTFAATASDAEDGNLAGAVRWTSTIDGTLGIGASLTTLLGRGQHTISAIVEDTFGLSDRATIAITVVDRPPLVTIASPTDGTFFPRGFPIELAATAIDDRDGSLSSALEWTSHRDGFLGLGGSLLTLALSPGDHVLTATVTNSLGTIGTETVGIVVDQAPPVVTIVSPAATMTAGEGTLIELAGTASDVEDGNLSGQIAWSSDLEGSLGTGANLSVPLFVLGTHRITAAVTDSHGATAGQEVAITVVPAPPAVTILSPTDGSTLAGAITLTGTAIDAQDGNVTDNLSWSSSLDGPLGSGGSLAAVQLSAGAHLITAQVEDGDDLLGSQSISIIVGVAAPTVAITEPIASNGPPTEATIEFGDAVTFRANAVDGFGHDLTNDIRWSSNLNGPLGSGASVRVSSLIRGRHVITAEATDHGGLTGAAAIVLIVTSPASSNVPTVSITTPDPGTSVGSGNAFTLTASATDRLGSDISDGIHWVSNHDGLLGGGHSLTTALYTLGTHTVSALAADGTGLVGSDTTSVTVGQAVLTFGATADTYSDQGLKASNFGAAPELYVGAKPVRAIYLRFDVTGVGGAAIERAVLRLQTTSSSSAGSTDGGTLHPITDNVWEELALTYSNRPAIDLPAIAAAGAVVPSQTVDFDVTSAVAGNGTYNFAITSPSSDATIYRSREAGVGGPELVLFLEPTGPQRPTVEITDPEDRESLPADEQVRLRATASDPQDGDLDIAILWRTNMQAGILGVGPDIRRTLSPGSHVITATVNDIDGNSAAALVHVVVGESPVVTIGMPSDGGAVPFGQPVLFTGSAHDPQDGDVSADIEWSSNRDGVLGHGPSIATTLSAGTHTVTASAIDSDGEAGSAAVIVTTTLGNIGFRDFNFGSVDQDDNRATASKPESKLWNKAGVWWATLFDPAVDAYMMHRLDIPTQQWINTGVLIDERPSSRQDVLLDDDTLYVVSRQSVPPGQNRLLRYSYHPDVQLFLPDAGFPVDIPGDGTESMTIAKDSTGTLWIAYTLDDRVFVSHTRSGEDDWADPFVVPVTDEDADAPQVSFDDIAAVQAIDGAIGVFWSNQLTRENYFAVHTDGTAPADPGAWTLEVAATGGSIADDHFNMKLASDGRLFVAVKTSFSASSSTLVGLLVREPSGAWSELHHVTEASFTPTRPLCLLDEVRRRVHVFYSPHESAIYTKSSDMDAIAFPDPDGIGVPFISNSTETFLNNPTSTKQNVDPATGLVVLASSKSAYWHNTIDPRPAAQVMITEPVDGLAVTTGTAVTFSGTAFSVAHGDLTDSLTWVSSLDGAIGRGASLTTAGLSTGEHVVTAAVTDSDQVTGSAVIRVVVADETPPVVTITAPATGARFLASETITFAATALDVLDGDLSGTLTWTSDRDGALGSGASIAVSALSQGVHSITARATDSAGRTATASLSVEVQLAASPTVTIISPPGTATVVFGDAVSFSGMATDAFDGDLTASLRWHSDRDGAIGIGGAITRSSLSLGTHIITATATDSHGQSNSATVTVDVAGSPLPTPPAVVINAPADSSIVASGSAVTFMGTANDTDDGDLSGALQWSSSRDGHFGTGPSVTTSALTPGLHAVMARVTDSDGLEGRAQVRITVDVPPVITIKTPAAGTSLLADRALVFSATATDLEDGDVSGDIEWTSDRDGTLGRGALVAIGGLSAGDHTLTAAVSSPTGAPATASLSVTVENDLRSIVADADTYVDAEEPNTALGDEDTFRVDASPIRQAFLRFQVTDLASFTIEDATLRLRVGPKSGHSSTSGGMIHGISDGGWSEVTTFATRPAIDGPELDSHGTVANDDDVDFDVTAAVDVAGTYNFALVSDSSDGAGYYSREASKSSRRPTLRLRLRQDLDPAIVITEPTSGSTIQAGTLVTLRAEAIDAEDGNVDELISWTSDRQGSLGTGATVTVALGAGRHTIRAEATDTTGHQSNAEIIVDAN